MNIFKKSNYIISLWAIEALNKDSIDFAVGGQAVVEGVMMRSPNHITIAVRKLDGKIKVRRKPYQTLVQRFKWLNIPILRGVINLFEMMIIGTDAINFSANESLAEPKEEVKTKKEKLIETIMMVLSFVVAIALSVFLFKFVPLFLTTILEKYSPFIKDNYVVFNLTDGILKILIFLSYIFLLSLIPNFRRIFEYHGAEHKSIFTYENKKDLTVENARKESRFHPRCGTSFILIVFVISIVVYTFIPRQENFTLNLLVRLAFLPLIAGISYESLKFSAKNINNFFVRLMITPGLWFQKITTSEPDDKQLKVGLTSLKEALEMEKA